jgi:rhodanese-related sulfurtransferase
MFGRKKLRDLTPTEVSAMMEKGEVLLIDVREPGEYAGERIHGALNFPLSTFDPEALPDHPGRTVVFQCGSGKRSAMAVQRCQAAGLSTMRTWPAAFSHGGAPACAPSPTIPPPAR